MSHSDRDITREFLQGIISDAAEEKCENLLHEITHHNEAEESSETFILKMSAIFGNRAEELGYYNIPITVWGEEVNRLQEDYNHQSLLLEEYVQRIEPGYIDEYIDDVAVLYEVNTKTSIKNNLSSWTLTKDFLNKLC